MTPPKKLFNGARVLEYVHLGDDPPNGGALCKWDHAAQPYVTWHVWQHTDGEWRAQTGHYFSTLAEAQEDFIRRCGARANARVTP